MLQVVIDASTLIGLCAEEPRKVQQIIDALEQYFIQGCTLYAPHLIVMEALYILCKKESEGSLTQEQHQQAIVKLQTTLSTVLPPPNGDASLIARSAQLRQGYECRRSADSIYLALAEELSTLGAVELLTFDQGQAAQATAILPQISVKLLTP